MLVARAWSDARRSARCARRNVRWSIGTCLASGHGLIAGRRRFGNATAAGHAVRWLGGHSSAVPSGGRPTDTASPNNVYDAEGVIDVFAAEVEATAQNEAGYCDVAIDPVHDGLTVWWHGAPPADIVAVLDRARAAHVTPTVRAAPFDHRSLGLAEGKLTRLMPQLGISETSLTADCSAVEVGLVVDRPSTEAAVTAILGPSVPVQFKQMPNVSF